MQTMNTQELPLTMEPSLSPLSPPPIKPRNPIAKAFTNTRNFIRHKSIEGLTSNKAASSSPKSATPDSSPPSMPITDRRLIPPVNTAAQNQQTSTVVQCSINSGSILPNWIAVQHAYLIASKHTLCVCESVDCLNTVVIAAKN